MGATLNITNGDHITDYLKELQLVNQSDSFFIWREMFCEGPTEIDIESESAIHKRKTFLNRYYRIPKNNYQEKFSSQFKLLKDPKTYDKIVLWFEYDLFCHINMVAAISLLTRKGFIDVPIYLVCSGKTKNDSTYKGLSQLSPAELKYHKENEVRLTIDDLEFAAHIWTLYCESNPKKIAGEIKKNSSFEYMSICLRAHLQRFPNMLNGLNVLEHNILEMINAYQIKNVHQLLGYALEYQGFYGYGDMQLKRVIARLFQFLDQRGDRLVLSERGQLALDQKKNFYNTQKLDWYYGGVKKYDYLYNHTSHTLLKL